MDDTPNLKLPYIMAAQAQKHVTHNEAILALDALVQISVADRNLTAPPVSPAEGDRYIVAVGATAAWSGKDGQVAAWQDGAWMFYAPLEGWLAWVADEDVLVAWDGSAWNAAASGGAGAFTALADTPADYTGAAGRIAVVNAGETALEFADEVPLVGVNATADATNRLAIASEASLFSHAGAGHQHKINKNAAGDTGSILFQTGFSGRAEFGTTGDDDWHVKVSPDGSTWHEALVADKDTGRIGLGTATPARRLDLLDAASPQLRLTNTDGVDYADLEVDGAGNLSISPSGGEISVYADNAGGDVAGALATIEQDGAGDAVLQWLLTGTRSWYAGVDNSDSDKWKLATTTGTPAFVADSKVMVESGAGVLTLGQYEMVWTGANASANGRLIVRGSGGQSGVIVVGSESAGAVEAFRSTGTSVRMLENSSVNLNVAEFGPSNARNQLRVYGANAANTARDWVDIHFSDGTNDAGIIQARDASSGFHPIALNPSGGNVGIGTATPSTKLDINGPARVGSYAVASVPDAAAVGAGAIIYVSDETDGAVLAFSDGADWRRVTDRAVIS